MKISLKEAYKAQQKEPGFWAKRTLNKTQKEYADLLATPTNDGDEIKEHSMFSVLHFLHTFGDDSISDVISTILSVSESDAETYSRIAHFFYHLGRNHERSIFK